ncbi:type II secretion system F family protein [Amorphus sp. 3PC139-8]|uniref:type II secretion system F family protein n=1 Tax=Amorphus sp. 3PC139-8 TaxID=2735676 RepID=UPI00345C69F3
MRKRGRVKGITYHFARIQFGFEKRLGFYQELAGLLRANLSKRAAIDNLYLVNSEEGKKKGEALAVIMWDVALSMRDGAELATAMRRWIPRDELMVIEATENSDDFPGQLDAFCETMRAKARIKGAIIGGLAYPVALFVMVYVLLTYFGSSVVPVVATIMPPEKWTGAARFLALLGKFAENWALPSAVGVVLFFLAIGFTLPRWATKGRKYVENLPIYSLYRTYTGVSFLLSLASLLDGGMPAIKALEKIRQNASPYVRYRVNRIRLLMLDGKDLGSALAAAGTGWPDKRMNLSIKIFAQTQELSEQLMQLSRDWLSRSEKRINTQMGLLRSIFMLLVFGAIISVVVGMYALQDQLAQELNRR